MGYTVVYCMAPQGEYKKALMSLVDVKTELLLSFVSQMTHRTQHTVSFVALWRPAPLDVLTLEGEVLES